MDRRTDQFAGGVYQTAFALYATVWKCAGSYVVMELIKLVVPAWCCRHVFSCYFDIFDGLIQAFVFVFLTSLYIGEAVAVE